MKKTNQKKDYFGSGSPFLEKNANASQYSIEFFVKDPNSDKGFSITYTSKIRKEFIEQIKNESVQKYNLLWEQTNEGSTAIPKEWLLKKLMYSCEKTVTIDGKYYHQLSNKQLQKAAFDPNISFLEFKKLLDSLDKNYPLIHERDPKTQKNLLHYAVGGAIAGGSVLKILILLENGVNFLHQDKQNRTPYDLANKPLDTLDLKFESPIFLNQPIWLKLLKPPTFTFSNIFSLKNFTDYLSMEKFKARPGFFFIKDFDACYYVDDTKTATKLKLSKEEASTLQQLKKTFNGDIDNLSKQEKLQLCEISSCGLLTALLEKHGEQLRINNEENKSVNKLTCN